MPHIIADTPSIVSCLVRKEFTQNFQSGQGETPLETAPDFMNDEQDYIAMLERTQIPMDHPLIRHLQRQIRQQTDYGTALQAWAGPKREFRATPDDLIQILESRGLGWSLDHNLIEARVWDWPNVIGRYRPNTVIPLAEMLAKAMYEVDWTKYPIRK